MSGCDGCAGGSCETCASGENGRLPPGMLKIFDVDQSTADGVLVFVETTANGMAPVSLELLGKARELTDGRVFAVMFGPGERRDLYPAIFGCGVDSLYHVREKRLETYLPEAWAESITALVQRIEPAIVLFGATPIGREIAPRVAASLRCGLTADCTGLKAEGRDLTATRPAFGGNLIADIRYVGYPQLATVRPGTFPMPEIKEGTGTAIYWQQGAETFKDVIEDVPTEKDDADIGSARVLISLGDGVRDRSLIDVAESVARKMGGMVSCSRALVEKGWMPRSRQVGMSGRTVHPDLYIAFGISGSVQHRAGMSGSKKVIAVNNDPDAPIHGFADVSLLADAGDVLRSLDRRLREGPVEDLLHMAGDLHVAPDRLDLPVRSDEEGRADGPDGLLPVGDLGAPGPDLLHQDMIGVAEQLDSELLAVYEPAVGCHGVLAHADDPDARLREPVEGRGELHGLPGAPGAAVLRIEVDDIADALQHGAVERRAVLVLKAERREGISDLGHGIRTGCPSCWRLLARGRSRRTRQGA